MLDDATQARLAAPSVIGRLGKPMEIADAVAFLVSEQASFITGVGARRRRRPMPADRMSAMAKTLSVGIIGAGPGGLALGIFLRKAGFRDFTIFDREDGVGGTWRINTYPGLACDVKSHLYSYSFDLNADWSRLWSGQPEILEYFEQCARALPAGPQPEAEHRNRLGAMGCRHRSMAADDRRRRRAQLRRRGLGGRPVHPAADARSRRGGAVHRHGDALRALGPFGRPDRCAGRGARHRFDCVATASRSGQGGREGLLGAALADLDPAEAGPAVHRSREAGCSRTSRSPRRSTAPGCGCAASRTSR